MIISNSFEKGPETWCSYEYHASMVAGQNIFILATWEAEGGVGNGGYVWVDQSRWSCDAPEKPLSILPLIQYRGWADEDPVDLRGAELAVYLRGDELALNGAECYFWIHVGGTRWHCSGHPIAISHGRWADEPVRFRLMEDGAEWYMSWSRTPENPAPLGEVMASAHRHGFSFVGFGGEVTGRLSLGGFEIARQE